MVVAKLTRLQILIVCAVAALFLTGMASASELADVMIGKVQSQHEREQRTGAFQIAKQQQQAAVQIQKVTQQTIASKSVQPSAPATTARSATSPVLAPAMSPPKLATPVKKNPTPVIKK